MRYFEDLTRESRPITPKKRPVTKKPSMRVVFYYTYNIFGVTEPMFVSPIRFGGESVCFSAEKS